MLKAISRERFLLFVVVLFVMITGTGLPAMFGTSNDDTVPHSLQLLTLLQQDSSAPAKIKMVRHNDKSELRTIAGGHWNAGLEAFRASKMRAAAEHFTAILADNEDISSSDRATVSFWAYRAFLSLGDKESAALYLGMAAKEHPGFYSILARHISGIVAISDARESDIPTVASLYPRPNWTPSSGYKVEPALLFAIMRQESEFNPGALSAKGAMGVMQLMPETARDLARDSKISGSIAEPAVSMALGQQYLKQLMGYPNIGNNMLFLLSAYNAGPAMLDKWQQNNLYKNDPLLFVESIPYGATRDYVVNVMGNYWVYAELFGDDSRETIAMVSAGEWPIYSGSTKQVVAVKN